MKRSTSIAALILALVFIIDMIHPGYGGQAAEDQIRKTLNIAKDLGDAGKFDKALETVRPLVDQAGRFTDKPELQYEILDYQHFLLLKTGVFKEAVQTGFKIEELGRKIGDRKSPWDCLKIADAYMGLKEYDQALDWVEKAVKERDFTKLETLLGEGFGPLSEYPRFKALLADVEKSLGIGQTARDFRIMLLDGTPFALSEQKGKVVLIDFWDVRCAPCRKAMTHLKELQQKYAGRGLVIVGISLDTEKKLLEDYLRKTDLPWKMSCTFKGWSDETAKLYRISATPSTWLIDRQGILRSVNLTGDKLTEAILGLI